MHDPKVKGTKESPWEDNVWPGCEETKSLPWTDIFAAADCPFLYCGLSEGSCIAFNPVLVAQALQMLEHASRVKGRKCPSGHHRAVLGQVLFPKSITVTPLQSQALEFISFSSVDKPLPLVLFNGRLPLRFPRTRPPFSAPSQQSDVL